MTENLPSRDDWIMRHLMQKPYKLQTNELSSHALSLQKCKELGP